MRGLALVCLWAGLLVAAGLHFGWTDEFHLVTGAAFLVFPGAIAVWIVRRRVADDELQYEDLTPHPARTLLIHGVCAALCVGYLTAGFHLLHAAGFGVSGLDRDRSAIEEKLQFLEEAGQFDRAADIVQERMGYALSDGWRHALAERLYRNLLNAGKECKDLRERRQRFAKALEVAQGHQLDSALALRLDEDSLLEGEFLNRLDTLRGGKDWRTLAGVLEANLPEDAPRRRHLPISAWLRDCLLDWSHELTDSNDKKEKLVRALAVCGKYALDDHAAKLALELHDKAMRDRALAAALPHGVKGGIAHVVSAYYPPAVIADVWIDTSDGRPVENLREKDFELSCGGQRISKFTVHEENRAVVPMQLIVAIDTSGSMQGPAMAAAESGSRSLVQGLHPLSRHHGQMWIQVLTFHGDVSVKAAWTQDMLTASTTLKGLKAEGSTALFKTVAHSVEQFRGRTGRKHLLLFTDGKDTEGGPNVETLVAMCKKEGVTISAIGLRSDDLDFATLRRLSGETGGSYGEADGPAQLLDQFRQAGARMRPHFYRLVFMPKGRTPGSLEVRVGGENSLVLKETVSR